MKEFYITKFDQITLILREANDAKKNSEYLNERGVISKPFPITSIKYEDYSGSNILSHKYNYAIITSPKAIKALDNIVSNNHLTLQDLNVKPSDVEEAMKKWLWRFRDGGEFAKVQ